MEESQPDYRLEIIEKDRLYLVYEGGKEICLGFVTRAEAEAWVIEHSKWHQPVCCICGSAATRAADPWTTIQVSVSSGAVKAHMSCWNLANAGEGKFSSPAARMP